MSVIKKHVGRIKNTDRRCVVAMMQIPGREDHALIIDTDALPDRFHDALMQIVDSHEGQSVLQLHTLLARRVLPDMNVDMMNALHTGGQLRAVPIDQVMMYPQPHSPCSLRAIIEAMGVEVPMTDEVRNELENQHIENLKANQTDEKAAIARSLLIQANDLEQAAAKKREEAFRMFPELREGAIDSPANPVVAEEHSEEPVAEEAPVVAEETVAESPDAATPPVVEVDTIVDPDLPEDVAAAYAATIELAQREAEVAATDADHAVDTSDESLEAFLDRAAYREDKANKVAQESAEPKRPVGRPRKDGTPAGSSRE